MDAHGLEITTGLICIHSLNITEDMCDLYRSKIIELLKVFINFRK